MDLNQEAQRITRMNDSTGIGINFYVIFAKLNIKKMSYVDAVYMALELHEAREKNYEFRLQQTQRGFLISKAGYVRKSISTII